MYLASKMHPCRQWFGTGSIASIANMCYICRNRNAGVRMLGRVVISYWAWKVGVRGQSPLKLSKVRFYIAINLLFEYQDASYLR